MVDAVRTCLRKYADFSGRATRSEYWWWTAAVLIVYVVAYVLTLAVHPLVVLLILLWLGLLLPGLAVSVRRLHDTGRSGWWILIGVVPLVGGIVLLVFLVLDSEPRANTYGPVPSAPSAGAVTA